MVTINELGSMALLLVIAAITIGVGATLQSELAENSQCTGTWGSFTNVTNTTSTGTNPADGSRVGCCTTVNVSANMGYDSGVCQVWYTGSIALNTTYNGLDANETLGQWLPIIAIIVAAVIVIGLLVTYLGGLGSRM